MTESNQEVIEPDAEAYLEEPSTAELDTQTEPVPVPDSPVQDPDAGDES